MLCKDTTQFKMVQGWYLTQDPGEPLLLKKMINIIAIKIYSIF